MNRISTRKPLKPRKPLQPRVNTDRSNFTGGSQPVNTNGNTVSTPARPDRVEFSHELAGYDEDMQRCGADFRCASRLLEVYA